MRDVLTEPPYLDDDAITVMDQIEAERKLDVPGEIDLRWRQKSH